MILDMTVLSIAIGIRIGKIGVCPLSEGLSGE